MIVESRRLAASGSPWAVAVDTGSVGDSQYTGAAWHPHTLSADLRSHSKVAAVQRIAAVGDIEGDQDARHWGRPGRS